VRAQFGSGQATLAQRTNSDTSTPRMTVENTKAIRVWPIAVRRIRAEVTVTSVAPKVVLTATEK
jgi:hypothetical protein